MKPNSFAISGCLGLLFTTALCTAASAAPDKLPEGAKIVALESQPA